MQYKPPLHGHTSKPDFSRKMKFGGEHLNPDEAIAEAAQKTMDTYAVLIAKKASSGTDDPASRQNAEEARIALVDAVYRRLGPDTPSDFAGAQLSDHAISPIRYAVDHAFGPKPIDQNLPTWRRAATKIIRFTSGSDFYSDDIDRIFPTWSEELTELIDETDPALSLRDAMQEVVANVYDQVFDWATGEASTQHLVEGGSFAQIEE